MMETTTQNTLSISDQEILNESGRMWNQWHTELTSKNFAELPLEHMAERLITDYSLEEDCAKVVALNYCRYIGRCEEPKSPHSLEISRTFNYPVSEVFDRTVEWLENENRAELQERINKKRLDCKWLSDNSKIGVKFNTKGSGKTQVVLKHNELDSESDVDIMRNFWKQHLNQMVETL